MSFHVSPWNRDLWWSAFLLVLVLAMVIYFGLETQFKALEFLVVGGMVTAPFFLLFTVIFLFYLQPIVFDLNESVYWRYWGGLRRYKTNPKYGVNLKEIEVVQIIPSSGRAGRASRSVIYKTYELNIVLRNGARMNILNHADLDCIRDDAHKLSKFLGVSLADYV